jgi:prevent-host-death family protein
MKTINACDARINFGELLAEVVAGETIEITDNGVLVARIVPAVKASPFASLSRTGAASDSSFPARWRLGDAEPGRTLGRLAIRLVFD